MVVGNLNATTLVLTALGYDVYCTVSAFVAIESYGCSILKYCYILNLLRADAGNVALDTINEYEWRVVTIQRLESTYVECGVLCGIASAVLQGDEAVALAKNAVANVLGAATIGLVGSNY